MQTVPTWNQIKETETWSRVVLAFCCFRFTGSRAQRASNPSHCVYCHQVVKVGNTNVHSSTQNSTTTSKIWRRTRCGNAQNKKRAHFERTGKHSLLSFHHWSTLSGSGLSASRSPAKFSDHPLPPAAEVKPPAPAWFAAPAGPQTQCSPLVGTFQTIAMKSQLQVLYCISHTKWKWLMKMAAPQFTGNVTTFGNSKKRHTQIGPVRHLNKLWDSF